MEDAPQLMRGKKTGSILSDLIAIQSRLGTRLQDKGVQGVVVKRYSIMLEHKSIPLTFEYNSTLAPGYIPRILDHLPDGTHGFDGSEGVSSV